RPWCRAAEAGSPGSSASSPRARAGSRVSTYRSGAASTIRPGVCQAAPWEETVSDPGTVTFTYLIRRDVISRAKQKSIPDRHAITLGPDSRDQAAHAMRRHRVREDVDM